MARGFLEREAPLWYVKVVVVALVLTFVVGLYHPFKEPSGGSLGVTYFGFPYIFLTFSESILRPDGFYPDVFLFNFVVWLLFCYVFAKRAWLVKTNLAEPERYI